MQYKVPVFIKFFLLMVACSSGKRCLTREIHNKKNRILDLLHAGVMILAWHAISHS